MAVYYIRLVLKYYKYTVISGFLRLTADITVVKDITYNFAPN